MLIFRTLQLSKTDFAERRVYPKKLFISFRINGFVGGLPDKSPRKQALLRIFR